jgi:hypothetical protein
VQYPRCFRYESAIPPFVIMLLTCGYVLNSEIRIFITLLVLQEDIYTIKLYREKIKGPLKVPVFRLSGVCAGQRGWGNADNA